MNSYKACPVSRNDIKVFVHRIKEAVGLENDLYFPNFFTKMLHFLF